MAIVEHSHIWEDGTKFTHTHKRGDIPHGHHGARYLKRLLLGKEQTEAWEKAGFKDPSYKN
jgi:hypothetical protein